MRGMIKTSRPDGLFFSSIAVYWVVKKFGGAMGTVAVHTRVQQDTVKALESVGVQRGMIRLDGGVNMSEVVRFVIEFGLVGLRLESRRADPGLPARTRDVRLPGASLQARIEREQVK